VNLSPAVAWNSPSHRIPRDFHLVGSPFLNGDHCATSNSGLRLPPAAVLGKYIITLESHGARFRNVTRASGEYAVLAHAPVLYARENTVGKFTDVPMIVYAERSNENGAAVLMYTVIFSNEDAATSTRALMARWGRTTDVEYVYKAYLNQDGSLRRATIQGRGHQEIEFDGRRDGTHPLLIPVTDNNMVSGEATSAI